MSVMKGLLGRISAFLASQPERPPIADPQRVAQLYRRHRLSLVVSLVLGYGFAYTCRLGYSVVKEPLINGNIFAPHQLGWIGAAFLWGYGTGKVVNGFWADYVNPRRFICIGVACSALINLLAGWNTLLIAAVVLWALNGWFQGILAPACVVSITHWFSSKNRGTIYGLWSTAHSLGEGLTYFGSAGLVALTCWQAAFIGPALACLLVAGGLYLTLSDRPQALGLPPVTEWDGVAEAGQIPSRSTGQDQRRLLLLPGVWIVGLASACMYMTRYAINSWGVLYLQNVHGLSLVEAGGLIGLNTIAGIGGCVAYGYLSDRFFGGRRPPLTLIFGLIELAGLVFFFLAPPGNCVWLAIGLLVYGFTLSGLLAVLGGLFAVDIAPPRAAGAAMGMVGVFSYVGAGLQELISGLLVQRGMTVVDGTRHYDFTWPVVFWIGASLASLALASSLWNIQSRKQSLPCRRE